MELSIRQSLLNLTRRHYKIGEQNKLKKKKKIKKKI